MDPNSKRREGYRNKSTALNLHRNHAIAADSSSYKPGNMFARFIGLVALVAVCLGVAWAAHMYFTIHSAIDGKSGGPIANSAKIVNKQPISVLVLGVDQGIEGRHDRGNSDTLILATANPQKNTATMTSIPRDTLTDIKGDPGNKYFMFRVNSAYEIGGSAASVKTVKSIRLYRLWYRIGPES